MAELSPAAQAVKSKVLATYADNVPKDEFLWALERPSTVAALRAVADQVVPEAAEAVGDQHDEARLDQWLRIHWKILAIAAELEATDG